MAVTKNNPNTIWLGGPMTLVNDIVSSEAITPGHLIERHGGKFRKHASAGAKTQPVFALDATEMNKGPDDAYASGDLIWGGAGVPGSTFWAWLASGENAADGDLLESNGDGQLAVGSDAKIAIGRAIEAKNASTGDARIRIEVQ